PPHGAQRDIGSNHPESPREQAERLGANADRAVEDDARIAPPALADERGQRAALPGHAGVPVLEDEVVERREIVVETANVTHAIYTVNSPPFGESHCPVMNAASSEARNAAAPAISSGLPRRPSGVWRSAMMRTTGGSGSRIGVPTKPGQMASTRIPREATSRATERVKPRMPALAAA